MDEDRVSVGEELTYTLRAVSHSPVPHAGDAARRSPGSRSSRGASGPRSASRPGPIRTTVLEIRLRAVRPGPLAARAGEGGAGARHGRGGGRHRRRGGEPGRDRLGAEPAAPALLDHAAPPPPGQPAVDLLVSPDSVRVGEQVDVVTAAWFPRDLRLQLRRPPTLAAAGDRRRMELSPDDADRHRRDAQHPGPLVRPVRLAPGRVPAGAGHRRRPAGDAQVQHAGRAAVLQPGGAVRAVESRRHAGRAPAARPPAGPPGSPARSASGLTLERHVDPADRQRG